MENRVESNMEHEIEDGVIYIRVYGFPKSRSPFWGNHKDQSPLLVDLEAPKHGTYFCTLYADLGRNPESRDLPKNLTFLA